MSHITSIQTKMTDINCIKKALENLGYICEENAVAYGYAQSKIQGDLVIRRKESFDIAIIGDTKGVYIVKADWWKSDISQEDFINDLLQEYAAIKIENEINNNGKFRMIGSREKLADGTQRIRITY